MGSVNICAFMNWRSFKKKISCLPTHNIAPMRLAKKDKMSENSSPTEFTFCSRAFVSFLSFIKPVRQVCTVHSYMYFHLTSYDAQLIPFHLIIFHAVVSYAI
jgi:hypothetical protein